MKEGFEACSDQIELLRFALPAIIGLVVYTLLGTVSTVLMQSSRARIVLILTALSAGQVTCETALALAIGGYIGTTVTATIGSLSANFQGKRLAGPEPASTRVIRNRKHCRQRSRKPHGPRSSHRDKIRAKRHGNAPLASGFRKTVTKV